MAVFKKPVIVLAAGGNPTAIFAVPDARGRGRYVRTATAYMRKDSRVEQVGFFEGNRHLQMSGGEFCGNATRAAAFVIGERTNRRRGTFTVSGFPRTVRYRILPGRTVVCEFPRFPFRKKQVTVLGNLRATLVDLGGIVHVVFPSGVPFDSVPDRYRRLHQQIVRELRLGKRAAVGVVWQEQLPRGGIAIHPVVWVRAIHSFFYETSCGSGTIASLLVGRRKRECIVQPSGEPIYAERRRDNTLVLRSRMSYRKQN